MKKRVEIASQNYGCGHNCSQAVACAYCEEVGIDTETMHRLMEGFGGGMGGTEGVCGALSAAVAIASLKLTERMPAGPQRKAAVYQAEKELLQAFKEKNESIICKDLKGMETGTPLRDCCGCVTDAAALLEELIFSKDC